MRARITLALAAGMLSAIAAMGAPVAKAQVQANNPYPTGSAAFWAWQNRPDLPAGLGEPRDWGRNAELRGWPVGPYPRPYDVAVFAPGVQDVDALKGSLAVVRQIFDNGSFSVTQMDDADCAGNGASCGRVVTRQYMTGPGVSFIHYLKDTRTTWGFAGGVAGWSAVNLGAGHSQGSGWYYPLMGNGPQLVSPELNVPLAGYNAIAIEMAADRAAVDTRIRLFFATADRPEFAMEQSAWLSAAKDGAVHTYRIYLGSHPDWRGTLTRLRLDPAGSGTTGGVFVQRVRLLNDTSSIFASMASLAMAR